MSELDRSGGALAVRPGPHGRLARLRIAVLVVYVARFPSSLLGWHERGFTTDAVPTPTSTVFVCRSTYAYGI